MFKLDVQIKISSTFAATYLLLISSFFSSYIVVVAAAVVIPEAPHMPGFGIPIFGCSA